MQNKSELSADLFKPVVVKNAIEFHYNLVELYWHFSLYVQTNN